MINRELDNITKSDGGQVGELLAALPRVEAPANFEFGVKAKIAAGAEGGRTSLFPLLKIAGSLGIVLIVASLVFFYATLPNEIVVAEDPAPSRTEVAASSAETPAPIGTSGPVAVDDTIREDDARVSSKARNADPIRERNAPRRSRNRSTDPRPDGNSLVRTLESANVIMPPGFESVDPRNQNRNSNDGAPSSTSLLDVIGILGIDANYTGGRWKVRSVTANSPAERAGVRANDVLEAVDAQTLSEKTSFRGSFSPKVLRVRRDGKSIDLDLQN